MSAPIYVSVPHVSAPVHVSQLRAAAAAEAAADRLVSRTAEENASKDVADRLKQAIIAEISAEICAEIIAEICAERLVLESNRAWAIGGHLPHMVITFLIRSPPSSYGRCSPARAPPSTRSVPTCAAR